jgi:hypothetical protein
MAGGGPLAAMGEASMLSHLDQVGKGLLHTEDVVYFLGFIGLSIVFVFIVRSPCIGILGWSPCRGGGGRGVSGYGGHNSVGFIGGGVDRGHVGEVS